MKKLYKIILLSLVLSLGVSLPSQASKEIGFGPKQAKILGSIKYSVVGQYNAQFNAFKGEIEVNDKLNLIKSVYLEIDINSLSSDCKWCDKIVLSDQLLAVSKYPKIIFTSDKIIKGDLDYIVHGILEMHGVKKQVSFPFQVVFDDKKNIENKEMDIKGEWLINRRDFNIVWNKLLDHGGILVGNFIKVNWEVKVEIKPERKMV